jgi:hypothetical protein
VSVPGLVLVRPQAPSSLPSSEVEQTSARRTFDMIDIVDILSHWYAGRSPRWSCTRVCAGRMTCPSSWHPQACGPGARQQDQATVLCPDAPPLGARARSSVRPRPSSGTRQGTGRVHRALQHAAAASSPPATSTAPGNRRRCPRAGSGQDPSSTGPWRAGQPVRTRGLKPLVTYRRPSFWNRHPSRASAPQRRYDHMTHPALPSIAY